MSNQQEAAAIYQILEQAKERVIITNKGGMIVYVNPAFERITGYSKEEVIGKMTPRILKSGQYDSQFYSMLWKTLLSGKSFHARFLNKKKDGSLYYEEQSISPVKNQKGEITHFVSTAEDLTPLLSEQDAKKLAQESYQYLKEVSMEREARISELKLEVNNLLKRLGETPKYVIPE